jgi:predicted transcriptional regulator
MLMRALLSIKPEYAEKILTGTKKYEFRKAIFKKDVDTVVIYATKPIGMVIGEFKVDNILQDQPIELWEKTKDHSGITQSFFDQYFAGRDKAFAIQVKNPFRYHEPFDLEKILPKGIAPQSFCYI